MRPPKKPSGTWKRLRDRYLSTNETISLIDALKKKKDFKKQDLYRLLGINVAFYRSRRGWTQEQLSKKVNLNRTSVYNIEAGRHSMSLYHVYTFSKALDIYPEQLLDVFPNGEKK